MIQIAWKINPALAIYLPERFKNPIIQNEVGRWVRSNTRSALAYPGALKYLLGEGLDPSISRDLKVRANKTFRGTIDVTVCSTCLSGKLLHQLLPSPTSSQDITTIL